MEGSGKYWKVGSKDSFLQTTQHLWLSKKLLNHQRHFGLARTVDFETYTRLEAELAWIKDAPLYLVIARDDPVLLSCDSLILPVVVFTGRSDSVGSAVVPR
jgi:hypothetical protein